jgi:hypothetical protein
VMPLTMPPGRSKDEENGTRTTHSPGAQETTSIPKDLRKAASDSTRANSSCVHFTM